MDSLTPLKLSPVKGMQRGARDDLDLWWSQTTPDTPDHSSTSITPNTSLDQSSYSSNKNSFLSAPATPPTPGKRGGHSISHGIRSILGEVVPQEDEEINVDGDISEEEDESYVPKKLRLAKKHINPDA